MENRLANSARRLVVQLSNATEGVAKLEAALGLHPGLETMLSDETTALQAGENAFLDARARLKQRRRELQQVIGWCREFVTIVRDLQKHRLGTRFSREWETLGFQGNIQIPMKWEPLSVLLGAMAGQLENHAAMRNQELNITAERAVELQDALAEAVALVNQSKSECERLFNERAKLVTRGRRLMRKVINDLAFELDPLDPRWAEFGLNKPGARSRPEAPEGLTMVAMGENGAAIKWPAVPLTGHYRVWMQVEGRMVQVGRTVAPVFVLKSMPNGAQLAVSAVNNKGESNRSAPIVLRPLGDAELRREGDAKPDGV